MMKLPLFPNAENRRRTIWSDPSHALRVGTAYVGRVPSQAEQGDAERGAWNQHRAGYAGRERQFSQ